MVEGLVVVFCVSLCVSWDPGFRMECSPPRQSPLVRVSTKKRIAIVVVVNNYYYSMTRELPGDVYSDASSAASVFWLQNDEYSQGSW